MSSDVDSYHKILKDKTRRQIILLLKEKKNLTYTELINTLGIKNTGTLNYHLKVLRELINKSESGLYHLTEKGKNVSILITEFSNKNSIFKGKKRPTKLQPHVKKILALSIVIIVLVSVYSIYLIGVHPEFEMPPSREIASGVVETSDGGYVFVGTTDSFFAGFNEGWLVKIDSTGMVLWNQTYGGPSGDHGESVIETSDGGFAIAGYTSSFNDGDNDFWLIKTDAHGNMQWNQTYDGGEDDRAYCLVETADGGFGMVGDISFSDGDTGNGWAKIWFVKTDQNGNLKWDKKFGGEGTDRAYSMVATSDGGYAIAGFTDSFGAGGNDYWLIKIDENGNLEWDRTFGGERPEITHTMIETSDGGYAIAGYRNPSDVDPTDIWLVKTDESGNLEWDQTIGAAYDHPWAIVETLDGGFAIVGSTGLIGEGSDVLLVKTDANGNRQWHKLYGLDGHDEGYALAVTSDGGYILAGRSSSFDAVGVDSWLIKTDVDGNMQWSKLYGK